MNAFSFITIVESYGGSPARWPFAARSSAMSFSAVHPTAKLIHDKACALDAALDTVMAPLASESLRARILKAVRESHIGHTVPQIVKAANDRLPYRAIAATLLVSGLLGFMGAGLPQMDVNMAYAAPLDANVEVNSIDEHVSYAWIGDSIGPNTREHSGQ